MNKKDHLDDNIRKMLAGNQPYLEMPEHAKARIVEKLTHRQLSINQPKTSHIWRIVKKITKFAAAAIFIAVIIGLHQFSSSIRGTGVVWADVAKRFESISSYKAQARRVLTEVGQEEPFFQCDIVRYFSPDHGSIEKSYVDGELVMLAYCSISERVALIGLPLDKVYYRLEPPFPKLSNKPA